MTIKDSTLLRRGIHSELFLLVYAQPDTGYGIAKRHQNTTKRPDTSKTSKALERLEKANYITLKNKKFHPNLEKLAYDLLEYLDSKDIQLDEIESKFIKDLLKQNSFFMILPQDVLYRILTQPPRIHHIDALQVICNHIGMMCTFFLMPKKDNKQVTTNATRRKTILQISDELDADILNVSDEMQTKIKGSKVTRKKKMETVNAFGSFMKSFILGSTILDKIPVSTLEKLENLWEQHEGFQIATLRPNNIKSLLD